MYEELLEDISVQKKEKWLPYVQNLRDDLKKFTEMLKTSSENFENNLNM